MEVRTYNDEDINPPNTRAITYDVLNVGLGDIGKIKFFRCQLKNDAITEEHRRMRAERRRQLKWDRRVKSHLSILRDNEAEETPASEEAQMTDPDSSQPSSLLLARGTDSSDSDEMPISKERRRIREERRRIREERREGRRDGRQQRRRQRAVIGLLSVDNSSSEMSEEQPLMEDEVIGHPPISSDPSSSNAVPGDSENAMGFPDSSQTASPLAKMISSLLSVEDDRSSLEMSEEQPLMEDEVIGHPPISSDPSSSQHAAQRKKLIVPNIDFSLLPKIPVVGSSAFDDWISPFFDNVDVEDEGSEEDAQPKKGISSSKKGDKNMKYRKK